MMKLKKLTLFCVALLTAVSALISCDKTKTGVSSIDSPVSSKPPEFSEEADSFEEVQSEQTKEEPSPPVLEGLGEHTVALSLEDSVTCVFTAEQCALYTLSTDDEGCCIAWENNNQSGCVSSKNNAAFPLEKGESLTLILSAEQPQEEFLSFRLIKHTPNTALLFVGDNEISLQKTENKQEATLLFIAPADGNYTVLSSENANISYVKTVEQGILEGGYTLFALQKDEAILFTVQTNETTFTDKDFCFVDISVRSVIIAGETTEVAVEDDSSPLAFYAIEAGRYTVSVSDGASVLLYCYESWSWVEADSFEAQANTLTELLFLSENEENAVITITKL